MTFSRAGIRIILESIKICTPGNRRVKPNKDLMEFASSQQRWSENYEFCLLTILVLC